MRPVHRRLARIGAAALLATGVLAVAAGPAGAQQLVDAGSRDNGSGAIAFIAFALMVFAIGFALFFMDRVRRRREEERSRSS
jgi:heme/copper-type cytochrome/quinol oxidase subunit 3